VKQINIRSKTVACSENLWVDTLVGGLEHDFYDFPYLGNFIIPADFHIFSEGLKPPTSSTFLNPRVILGYTPFLDKQAHVSMLKSG
jgi:hypothetical protein